MVGSSCFALGALPLYANAVGPAADGVTYFVGSIFFTSAALLQVLLSAGVIRADQRPRTSIQWRSRVRTGSRPEWWAGVVQFVGTLMFNISTYSAMQQGLTAAQAQRRVWTPDARGCIAFLIASALVYADVRRPWLQWRPRDLTWSVAMLNMTGSIAFAISALGAYVVPSTGRLGEPRARQPRHVRRWPVLPVRRPPPHPAGRPGGDGRRCRRRLGRPVRGGLSRNTPVPRGLRSPRVAGRRRRTSAHPGASARNEL